MRNSLIDLFVSRVRCLSLRLTPALLAVVFWYAFVMEHVGSGPYWNSAIAPNAELCKYNAWMNLLYVQNFIPFEEMVSRREVTFDKKEKKTEHTR